MSGFLSRFFRSKPVPPYRDPPGFTPRADTDDSGDMITGCSGFSDENTDDVIDGVCIAIAYRDATGNASERVVDCARLDETYLMGHCLLRNAFRTFRIDRIESVIDYRTGEIFDDPADFFAGFGISPPAKRISLAATESVKAHKALISRARPGVRILVHFAASDGKFHPLELQVIVRYAAEIAAQVPPIGKYSQGRLERWICGLRPTEAHIAKSVERLAADDDALAHLTHTIADLIQADGHIDEAEIEASRAFVDAVRDARKEIPASPRQPLAGNIGISAESDSQDDSA